MKAAAEAGTKVGTASGAAPLPQLAAHPAAAAPAPAANRLINIHKLTCIIRFLFIVVAVVVALVN